MLGTVRHAYRSLYLIGELEIVTTTICWPDWKLLNKPMKNKFLPFLIVSAIFLSACMSDSGSPSQTSNNNTGSSTVTPTRTPTSPTVTPTPTPTTAPTSLAVASPPATVNTSAWLRIPMHYRLLLGKPHIWGETGGNQGLNVRSYAASGSSSLSLASTAGLIRGQLISYRGRNSQYYSAQIQSISNNNLQLTTPLQQDVFVGTNAWNFYKDGSHPNRIGSYAIADFAIRRVGWSRLNQGKHVLLGDSWFSQNDIFQRLRQRLPAANFSNKGVGGNTAGNLLSRFNGDVAWQNPNYVWILTGTNDYWQDVGAVTYKNNMRQLINRVRGLGATPIVFDSSVGPLNYGSDTKTRLSRSYVTAVDQLAGEN